MLNDNAVFTAATGYVYYAPVGTAAPTPAQLAEFNPDTFGSHTYELKITGSPTGGTYTITAGGDTTEAIKHDASAAEVQAALDKLGSVGTGGAVVTGVNPKDGYQVSFIGDNFAKTVEASVDSSLTGGTTSKADLTEVDKPIGWEPLGHTDDEELPEFGYEGGETEAKGSWQRKNLREVSSEAPVDYVTVKALQFDAKTLEMYYGKNASKIANVFGVDDPSAGGVEYAFLIVMVDGLFKISFSAAKASVRRDESITLATDDFSILPLRSTFVKHPGRHLFEWTTPAVAGTENP